MLTLDTPIEKVGYVGPRNAPRLKRLGIKTVRDLLWHFPNRHEDFSQIIKISEIRDAGETVSIQGTVFSLETTMSWRRRRMSITSAIIDDGTDSIRAVWFNQPYLERTLTEGTIVSLSGKVSLDKRGLYLSSPSYEKLSESELGDDLTHTGRLIPVYPETVGVTSKYLRFLIKKVLPYFKEIPDPLPDEILNKYSLPALSESIQAIHFPQTDEQIDQARYRFAFEELLLFQLRALKDRQRLHQLIAPQIKFDKDLIATFVSDLPFKLTNDQRVATFEILKDLEKPHPMNRLLNGDVGSGKTVVALIAAYQTAKQGLQTVFMAPTEILAQQHYATIKNLLSKESDIKIGILTGSEAKQWPIDEITEEKISKKLFNKKIAAGDIQIIIGTHAVIQKDVEFKQLGLVIIDEQHRFGVGQRKKLVKTESSKAAPHLLSMTATPIPRTLALTIYGDLDVSLIKEKPKGRQEIITKVISGAERSKYYRFIEQEIIKGRQVFVICPRIEISKPEEPTDRIEQHQKPLSQAKLIWADVKAVTEEYERLQKEIFPHRKVSMLHGKLKAKEKEEIMVNFKDHRSDILVSTSVIEVGVDVPNATIMMIESSERFGLAQLHQFRGRVGRDQYQSYCFLFTSQGSGSTRRLQSLEKTNNGFELAEMDLKIRGPGEFTGLRQSGIPDLSMSSLTDIDLIKKARTEAQAILAEDSSLEQHALLAERLKLMQEMVHFE